MKLYQFPHSPFAIKVRVAAALKHIPLETIDITLERYSELLRLNPRAKVPVLVDGETTVVDSTAIVTYLERQVPAPPLVPTDPARRARTWLLEDWSDESLYWYSTYLQVCVEANARVMGKLYVTNHPPGMHERITQQVLDNLREQARQQGMGRKPREVVLEELARHTTMLATVFGAGPYFGGDAPDLADCALYGQCRYLARLPEGAPVVASDPLASWFRRMHVHDPVGLSLEPYHN